MKHIINKITLCLFIFSSAAFSAYPDKNIQGIIQWGAGGSADSVMRSISPYVEEALGEDIILTNKTGGVGAIAVKYVNSRKGDGYTLLMGAENPQMYKVLGLSNIDYSDMVPISLIARGTPIIVASNDAPFNNMSEFSEYVKSHPGSIKVGTTGKGGLSSIVLAMLKSQVDLDYTSIPYNGDGPALTALQGKAIDVMPVVLGAAIEHIKSGKMKVIGLIDNQKNSFLPNVEPITKVYPGFDKYLPWGPFFGVFVKKDTPEANVKTLQLAFNNAAKNPNFIKIMENKGFSILNIYGDDATSFLEKYRSTSSWLVYDAGLAKYSPEKFGIKKP
ncbi:tripartite tricarboxylate transporter substrate binding protein [Marinomonas sp.]|uniref:tripartite tricarboxylate transporter substrate binding protein n=1 Tax=Marinomonas sp. TaxID=1904862 RepID=UPI003A938888